MYAASCKRNGGVQGQEVLEQVGLGDKIHHRPTSLRGQQQRCPSPGLWPAALPSSLPTSPPRPPGFYTSREALGMLQNLHRQGNTVVLITHDNSIAVQAQRIIRLEDGHGLRRGRPRAGGSGHTAPFGRWKMSLMETPFLPRHQNISGSKRTF